MKGFLACVGAALVLSACSTADRTVDDPGVDGASPPSVSSSTPPSTVAVIPVNIGPTPRAAGTEKMQLWADDVAAGRLDELKRKCWTISPEKVALMYGDPATIQSIMAAPAIFGQVGMIWRAASGTVSVSGTELSTTYPCPIVTTERTENQDMASSEAAYVVIRALRRALGQPVNPDDVESRYPLTCLNYGFWRNKIGHDPAPSVADAIGRVRTFNDASVRTSREGDLVRVKVLADNRQRSFLVAREMGGSYCIPEVTG